MMYPFIFFFCALCSYICLYGIFISVTTDCVNVKTFCPKLPSPKLILYFWMKLEYLFCRDAFNCLNYSCCTKHRYTLYQKMNMVIVGPNLNKEYLIPFRYFKANFFQALVNGFCEYNTSVFGRANKMIQQY